MCSVNTSPRTAPFGTCPLNFNTYADHRLCTNDACGNTLSRLLHLFDESVREISSRLSRCPPPGGTCELDKSLSMSRSAQVQLHDDSRLEPIVGIVFAASSCFSAHEKAVSPAASSPAIHIFTSISPTAYSQTCACLSRTIRCTCVSSPSSSPSAPKKCQTNGNQYVLTVVKLPLV